MTDSGAPVCMSAETGVPSTSTSKRLCRIARVNRGFLGWLANAASPLGAALVSFPKMDDEGMATASDRAADSDNAGSAGKLSGRRVKSEQEHQRAVGHCEHETKRTNCLLGGKCTRNELTTAGHRDNGGKYGLSHCISSILACRHAGATGLDRSI